MFENEKLCCYSLTISISSSYDCYYSDNNNGKIGLLGGKTMRKFNIMQINIHSNWETNLIIKRCLLAWGLPACVYFWFIEPTSWWWPIIIFATLKISKQDKFHQNYLYRGTTKYMSQYLFRNIKKKVHSSFCHHRSHAIH